VASVPDPPLRGVCCAQKNSRSCPDFLFPLDRWDWLTTTAYRGLSYFTKSWLSGRWELVLSLLPNSFAGEVA